MLPHSRRSWGAVQRPGPRESRADQAGQSSGAPRNEQCSVVRGAPAATKQFQEAMERQTVTCHWVGRWEAGRRGGAQLPCQRRSSPGRGTGKRDGRPRGAVSKASSVRLHSIFTESLCSRLNAPKSILKIIIRSPVGWPPGAFGSSRAEALRLGSVPWRRSRRARPAELRKQRPRGSPWASNLPP